MKRLRNMMNFGCLAGARLDSTADLGIMSIETEDPSQMFEEFATWLHQITHGL